MTARLLLRLDLVLLGLAIGLSTACFEGFEALETRVEFDVEAQTFHVERRVVNVSAAFLGCTAEAECQGVVERLRAFSPAPAGGPAERLMQRILESGASELSLELDIADGRVDAVLRYDAAVGSAAAEDTMVDAEWEGKGDRGDYLLTIDGQASSTPPDRYRTRRVARSGPAGPEWYEVWVLPRRSTVATTHLDVEAGTTPLLTTHPGLLPSLGGAPAPAPPVPVPPAPVAVAPVPVPSTPVSRPTTPAPVAVVVPAPTAPRAAAPIAAVAPIAPVAPAPVAPAPVAPAPMALAPAATAGGRTWLAPDPASPAKTWVFDAVVTGGALSVAAAIQSSMPLHARAARCYQDRHAQDPTVQGTAFLSALVRPDGFVSTVSVYGQVQDRTLLTCLEAATADWTFPAFGVGEVPSEVTLPLLFKVETPPRSKGRR